MHLSRFICLRNATYLELDLPRARYPSIKCDGDGAIPPPMRCACMCLCQRNAKPHPTIQYYYYIIIMINSVACAYATPHHTIPYHTNAEQCTTLYANVMSAPPSASHSIAKPSHCQPSHTISRVQPSQAICYVSVTTQEKSRCLCQPTAMFGGL